MEENYNSALLAFPSSEFKSGIDRSEVNLNCSFTINVRIDFQLCQIIGNISSVFFLQKKHFQACGYIDLLLSLVDNNFSQEKLDKYKERRKKCLKRMKPVPARDIVKEKDKLKIKFDEEAGRYAVALEDIEIGDIIVKDAPTACSLKYKKNLQMSKLTLFSIIS